MALKLYEQGVLVEAIAAALGAHRTTAGHISATLD